MLDLFGVFFVLYICKKESACHFFSRFVLVMLSTLFSPVFQVPSFNPCGSPVGGVRHRDAERKFVRSDFDTVRDRNIFNMFSL